MTWPHPGTLFGDKSDGVAWLVIQTPNSIGYLVSDQVRSERDHDATANCCALRLTTTSVHHQALATGADQASLINKDGIVVAPTAQAITFAMLAYSDAFSDRFTTDLVNAPSQQAWPLAGWVTPPLAPVIPMCCTAHHDQLWVAGTRTCACA